MPGSKIPGPPNLPPLPSLLHYSNDSYSQTYGTPLLQRAFDSHNLNNYLGFPTRPEYTNDAQRALEEAKTKLQALVNYDSGYYESKKNCDPIPPPSPQNQQMTQNLKRCRVSGVEEYNHIKYNRGVCVIQGSVMTTGGLVDGKTKCGTCNTIIGDLPPNPGSCQAGMETNPLLAFMGLNKPILCPPNWDSGW